MFSTTFYQTQAQAQQRAADDASLANVRERCQRASNAWSALAKRSERSELMRAKVDATTVADESSA